LRKLIAKTYKNPTPALPGLGPKVLAELLGVEI
jgi:hypothetical protein